MLKQSSLEAHVTRAAALVAALSLAAAVHAGSARAQSQARRPAPTPPAGSQVAVKLLDEGDAAACGETSRSKWQACQRVARCSPRNVDPEVVNALVDAVEEKAAAAFAERARGKLGAAMKKARKAVAGKKPARKPAKKASAKKPAAKKAPARKPAKKAPARKGAARRGGKR